MGGFPRGDQGRAQLQPGLGFAEERVPQRGEITTKSRTSRLLPCPGSSLGLCPGAAPVEKEKQRLALQGVAPCQGLDGECDKVCLLLPAWFHEPSVGFWLNFEIQSQIKPGFWMSWLLGTGVTWRPVAYGASKSGIGISYVVSAPGPCWQSRTLGFPLESCQFFTKFYPEAGK